MKNELQNLFFAGLNKKRDKCGHETLSPNQKTQIIAIPGFTIYKFSQKKYSESVEIGNKDEQNDRSNPQYS